MRVFRSRRPVMFFFGRFFSAGSDPARRARKANAAARTTAPSPQF
jgi:hypothetical protein